MAAAAGGGGTEASGARRLLVGSVLGAGLVAATWPAWRVAMLGSQPTMDELLRLRCSSRNGAVSPPPRAAAASRSGR